MYNVYSMVCGVRAHTHYNIPPRASSQNSDFFKSIQIIYVASFLFLFEFFSFGALHIHLYFMYNSLFFSSSVHGPFNSNVAARSPFSRPRRIYHVPVVKRPTIRDIHHSAVKKIPFYMEKFAEPSLHPSDKIMFSVYKKKRRIFQRSN